jgi:hypothetical protein
LKKRILLPLAGVAALSFSANGIGQSTPAAPDAPVTAPAVPPPSSSSTPFPALPAYQQPGQPNQAMPPPTKAERPVVAPATPTPQAPVQAYVPYGTPDEHKPTNHNGSVYIPLDSWIYPAMSRLYSMGFANTEFLGMRPYTRQSLAHILDETQEAVAESNNEQAQQILTEIQKYLAAEAYGDVMERGTVYGTESVYGRVLGISGPTLNDSYHLGKTISNDYGRPYESGFNSILGFSEIAERGRFSLYVRGEYQHAPSANGYSQALSKQLSVGDEIPFSGFQTHQATIPTGPIAAVNPFRLVEATLSFHLLGNEISGGKSDAWLGPAQGGAMAWSNNAENIYSFRINRVEPLSIPLVSRVLGPLRYDFFYGSLKGHTRPNSPYVHSLIFSFRPTKNFEFAFQRTVIFGGKGHEPVTVHNFLRSFFSISDTSDSEKNGPNDPGARFSDFSFSYRLPFVEKYATLVADSMAHDDVTPISAPRSAAYRTGIYLSQIPGLRKMDFRVEAVSTDPGVRPSFNGQFNYFEIVQRQGYTNKGDIMGDWIGREAKGGQAWITYHLSANEMVQVEYLNKKTPKDFIPGAYNPLTNTYGPGGTTQNQFKVNVVKRLLHDQLEVNGWFQHEGWKAPIYLPGLQTNNAFAVQLTLFPELKSRANH